MLNSSFETAWITISYFGLYIERFSKTISQLICQRNLACCSVLHRIRMWSWVALLISKILSLLSCSIFISIVCWKRSVMSLWDIVIRFFRVSSDIVVTIRVTSYFARSWRIFSSNFLSSFSTRLSVNLRAMNMSEVTCAHVFDSVIIVSIFSIYFSIFMRRVAAEKILFDVASRNFICMMIRLNSFITLFLRFKDSSCVL